MTGSHISLFSGVGMADLAAEAAGYKTIATAEVDPWCRKVLAKRFPDAAHFDDVRKVIVCDDGNSFNYQHPMWGGPRTVNRKIRRPLLVSGGFPCQDVSGIGTGKGVREGARSGLWSEFARVIKEFKPERVLIENSPMLRSRGLDVVLADLSALGYDCQWDCIPAAAVGAPHLRDRIFIVAVPSTGESGRARGKQIAYVDPHGTIRQMSKARATGVQITKFPRAGRLASGLVFEDQPRATHKAARQAILRHAVPCAATPNGYWPTPAASIPQDGENPDTWLARRAKLLAKGINGNGAGMPLSIALKLFPTPRAAANEWRTTRNAPTHGNGHGATLAGTLNDAERSIGQPIPPSSESAGNVNPAWVEWLMGLPQGWTDLSIPNEKLAPHNGWVAEPADVPRLVASPPDRKARLRALGNGLVPQAAAVALTMIPNEGAIHV